MKVKPNINFIEAHLHLFHIGERNQKLCVQLVLKQNNKMIHKMTLFYTQET
jgi:hypothetical protein